MTTFRHAFAAVLVLGLAACGEPAADAPAPAPKVAPQTPAPVPADAHAPAIALAPDGIRLVAPGGATRPLDFGMDQAETVVILDRVHGGAGKATTNAECGAGPVDFVQWPDGLSALFQDGKFVGWSVGTGGAKTLTTMNGIGIGSTRSELVAGFSGVTVQETTLGQEFDAGGLYGVLSGPGAGATIDALWAGVSCVFR